ncbi:unnamed protein product [Closterium sp. Naga37s-1]|nr:unnamed protein product [Closterium sp. Naga37s-1]
MAHSTRFAVLALAALLALFPAHAAPAAPACALTGLPPKKPVVPPARCPGAAQLSCCSDCSDTSLALQLVSTNLAQVVHQINPGLDGIIDEGLMVCEAFKVYPKCMLMIEAIVCGTTCNPDSGSYVSKSASGEYIMTVCPEYANATYDMCKDVEISGFALSGLVPDANAMMTMIVSNVIAVMGVTNFNITIAPGTCFTGAASTPAYTPCCDPLAVDPKCPAGSVDTVNTPPASPSPTPASPSPPPPPPKSGAGSAASLMSMVALAVGAAAVLA